MANDEQLNLLKASVAGWNAWREANPDAELNEMVDLRGTDFTNANMDSVVNR